MWKRCPDVFQCSFWWYFISPRIFNILSKQATFEYSPGKTVNIPGIHKYYTRATCHEPAIRHPTPGVPPRWLTSRPLIGWSANSVSNWSRQPQPISNRYSFGSANRTSWNLSQTVLKKNNETGFINRHCFQSIAYRKFKTFSPLRMLDLELHLLIY